jgi:hypothetical protein
MLCKGDGLQINIFALYSWEMALNVGLDVSFGNMWDWEGIWENAGNVTKA